MHGKRLNPRKSDLHRWRETFAERLREWGVDAEATRQATAAQRREYLPLWRIKAKEEGRERNPREASRQARDAKLGQRSSGMGKDRRGAVHVERTRRQETGNLKSRGS
jgi:hypothetical protein